MSIRGALSVVLFLGSGCLAQKSNYTLKAVMIPMRDGVHLQTVIIAPDLPPFSAR